MLRQLDGSWLPASTSCADAQARCLKARFEFLVNPIIAVILFRGISIAADRMQKRPWQNSHVLVAGSLGPSRATVRQGA